MGWDQNVETSQCPPMPTLEDIISNPKRAHESPKMLLKSL